MGHTPVLLDEVIAALAPQAGGKYIDGTVGDGGHTAAILEHSQPNSMVLGLDQDPQQITWAKKNLSKYGKRVQLVTERFSALAKVAQEHDFTQPNAILLDLGFSSRQLEDKDYGLTFADEANLDMRLSPQLPHTAADLLNHSNETELADILFYYGDRHKSRSMAKKLVQYRQKKQFADAGDLKEALNLWQPSQLAPVFQAFRIAVNDEYNELKAVLPQALTLLASGGKLMVITFHSGEDRIVKQFMQKNREFLAPEKIIRPSYEEVKRNPRARSALLRVATKK